jgi:hypothetical protein
MPPALPYDQAARSPIVKIRIQGQSLRFRLGQSEVDKLAKGQEVKESIVLSPEVRHDYVLLPRATEQIFLKAESDRVVVHLPKRLLPDWAESDEVGMSAETPIGGGKCVKLLIEKDFACIDNTDESQADKYPNPKAKC